jgi:3',5'-cyclic AMP phosphodiesterase CpdA
LRLIAQISDLHFGRHDPAVVEALLSSLNGSPLDLVVVSGDLTQRAHHDEFEAVRAFLDRLEAKTLVIPGNHDVSLHNPLRRLWRPLRRYRRYISTEREPFFWDEEIAVLGLSTVRRLTGKNGRVGWSQMDTIRRTFGGVPGDLFKVLATHHPLAMPPGADPQDLVGRAEPALNVAAESGVHLLLSGHYHRSFSGEAPAHVTRKRSLLVVHAGTAVSTRTRGGEVNSYNQIRFESAPCRLTVRVMAWAEKLSFVEVRREPYALRDGHWHRATEG